ncbi:RICIN domain-containing protein [Aquimarina sp. RZ0]|uniref:RICIN domain-containing protein n=1 Tax=Aquimarina sp. RZ0 TaxID=2607730 RepID=UPI0011F1DA33|nr:RICIN domain-containing protein [Aquimarina sp. RZ0]KAA1247826.1 T9SS type A sorting domain-containing protein [Aquimarina sp. RZ0]
MKFSLKTIPLGKIAFLFMLFQWNIQINAQFTEINASNGGKVLRANAPGGTGNVQDIRNKLTAAGVPAEAINSRLTNGVFSRNIAQTAAVKETASFISNTNNRPATYTGTGQVVNANNLENRRAAIAANGGTFIFRGTINIPSKSKLIQVGSNTTIWIDGTVKYTGPIIPGTTPDIFSVSDVINGAFEVRGSNNSNTKNNVKFFGTRRGKIETNDRAAGIFTRFARNLTIQGIKFVKCRNVVFVNNTFGSSVVRGNIIHNSTRRAIHIKASRDVLIEKNFIYDADVDGIDLDAFSKFAKVRKNVLVKSGSRYQVWTEIVTTDCEIDANVGIHVNKTDGGFQENGSENGQSPTARNKWTNNHVFYADGTAYRQGFSFHPQRVIDKGSTTFNNNFVWQTENSAHKRNPKNNTLQDVKYYISNGSAPPPPPPTGNSNLVHIRKRNAGNFAIDGRSGGSNGQNVYLWNQNSSNNNQQWEEIDRGNGFYSYKKKGTNFCLDGGNGGDNGQNIYLWSCSANNQNQHWKKISVGGDNYRLEKRNAPGYSIDGNNGGNAGQNIYLWSSNNNNQNQHWKFTSVNNRSNNFDTITDGAITMFPNPVSDQLTIMGLTNEKYNLHIYNIQGALSYDKEIRIQDKTATVDISNLPVGSYIIKIFNSNNVLATELLMINR